MKKIEISIISLVLIAILFWSCKDSRDLSAIKEEYERLKIELERDLEINSIKIIEVKYPSFEQLANNEFRRMQNLNDNLSKLVEFQFKMDSVLKRKVDIRNYENRYAFDENHIKNEKENEEDSLKIRKEITSRLNNELHIIENQLKMLEIELLVKSDSTLKKESKWMKHQIKYSIDGNDYCDTLVFVSFGIEKYQYLTENIFRKHE